jgi:regulatory protein
MNNDEFEKGKQIAYRFLSYRPRSRREIEKKLREKKITEENVNKVINFLKENNYINDREFAVNWVRYRMENRPRGKRALEYELREKGIDLDLIKESLDEVYKDEFDEYVVAVRLAEKKMASFKDKRKLLGYLQRKGFSYDLIEKVVSNLLKI